MEFSKTFEATKISVFNEVKKGSLVWSRKKRQYGVVTNNTGSYGDNPFIDVLLSDGTELKGHNQTSFYQLKETDL